LGDEERFRRLRIIEELDSEQDLQRIWLLDFFYEFPEDLDVGQWLAFYATPIPPEDAKCLRTGDMVDQAAADCCWRAL
jgi:hypothetical protein